MRISTRRARTIRKGIRRGITHASAAQFMVTLSYYPVPKSKDALAWQATCRTIERRLRGSSSWLVQRSGYTGTLFIFTPPRKCGADA